MTSISSAGRPGPDIFPEPITTDNMHELRVGQIGTVKGRLEAVRFGDAGLGRRTSPNPNSRHLHSDEVGNYGNPSLVITFPDWDMLSVTLRDYHTAKAIPYPLGTYVAVKVQCIHEDGDLMALAIWELGANPVPIVLGEVRELTTIPNVSGLSGSLT